LTSKGIFFPVLVIFLLAASVLTAGAGGKMDPSGPVITETYQGGPLAAKVGEIITLNLRNPGSGGYSIVTPVYDARVLKLISEKHVPAQRGPVARAGDFGRIVYEFQAIGAGETELAIKIARPWEKQQPPKEFLRVTIKVTQ
jgi:predicted secreted protein